MDTLAQKLSRIADRIGVGPYHVGLAPDLYRTAIEAEGLTVSQVVPALVRAAEALDRLWWAEVQTRVKNINFGNSARDRAKSCSNSTVSCDSILHAKHNLQSEDKTMKRFDRDEVIELFVALGHKTAPKWADQRIADRCAALPEELEEEDVPPKLSKPHRKLLDEILEAVGDDEELDFVADGDDEDDEDEDDPKPAKKKGKAKSRPADEDDDQEDEDEDDDDSEDDEEGDDEDDQEDDEEGDDEDDQEDGDEDEDDDQEDKSGIMAALASIEKKVDQILKVVSAAVVVAAVTEDEDEDDDPKPVKKAARKKTPAKKSSVKISDVVDAIIAMFANTGSEKRAITKVDALGQLEEQFPDKKAIWLSDQINRTVPAEMKSRGYNVRKTKAGGFWVAKKK